MRTERPRRCARPTRRWASSPPRVRLLGNLDDVWIPVSNYQVRPFVGAMPDRPRLIPQAQEVAAVMELPIRRLLAPDAVDEEEIEVRGYRLRAAVYRYGGERIWGATARTLAMFAQVVREAARGSEPRPTAGFRDAASGPSFRPGGSAPAAARVAAAGRPRC